MQKRDLIPVARTNEHYMYSKGAAMKGCRYTLWEWADDFNFYVDVGEYRLLRDLKEYAREQYHEQFGSGKEV